MKTINGVRYLTTVEAAKPLNLSPSTLRVQRHDKRERVKSVTINSRVYYRAEEVERAARKSHSATSCGPVPELGATRDGSQREG